MSKDWKLKIIDNFKQLSKASKDIGEQYRARSYAKAVNSLSNYKKPITKDTTKKI